MAAWERLDKSKSLQLGSVDCHAHTRTCSRFNVTVLPSVLLFTSSSPSPVIPHLGVIDSTHLLQALGQGVGPPEHQTQLVSGIKLGPPLPVCLQKHCLHLFQREVTPASLPLLLRSMLATPLVLWCDDGLASELSEAFIQTVQENSEAYSNFSFGWINRQVGDCNHLESTWCHHVSNLQNSSKHSRLLVKGQQFPSVVAVRFAQVSEDGCSHQQEAVSRSQATYQNLVLPV